MVAARVGKKVAAVVKMAKKDEYILQPMKDVAWKRIWFPAMNTVTTYAMVVHSPRNVDERKLAVVKSAGLISINDVPTLSSTWRPSGWDFGHRIDMALMKGLKSRGYSLSATSEVSSATINPR